VTAVLDADDDDADNNAEPERKYDDDWIEDVEPEEDGDDQDEHE